MSKTLRPLAGLAAASALLLSGCGVAGTGFHPGVAAEVGDDTISLDHVDEVAAAYCEAIESQLSDNQRILPHSYLRSGIAGQLALVSAAGQLAAEHGVEAGLQYDQKLGELRGAVSQLSEAQQDAVIEVESAQTYVSSVLTAVGDQLLVASGTAEPQPSDAAAEGQEALAAWFDAHDVEIDPQFGLVFEKGQPVVTDTSISAGIGTSAKNGQAETPDQVYAASLPDSHRCG